MTTNQAPTTALLADDHAVVRAGIRQFLELAGDIRVIAEASDGCEACRLAAEQRPRWWCSTFKCR